MPSNDYSIFWIFFYKHSVLLIYSPRNVPKPSTELLSKSPKLSVLGTGVVMSLIALFSLIRYRLFTWSEMGKQR